MNGFNFTDVKHEIEKQYDSSVNILKVYEDKDGYHLIEF